MNTKFKKITISGKICTGKTTLYKALKDTLGWETFSTGQFFRDYAKKHALSIEAAEEQNEEITKKIDFQVRDILKIKDHIIVEGWMAGIMANSFPGILKVLLVCNDKERIRRFAEREKVSSAVAAERVKDRDSSWLKEISKIYHRTDIFDSSHYDLVVNTSQLDPEAVLETVLSFLPSRNTAKRQVK